jgi:DNA-binding protein WhiA
MEMIGQKIIKEITNDINRKTNCDTANISKTVAASIKHIEIINRLKKSGLYENLNCKLQAAAVLRLKNPELSISELAKLPECKMSRSALFRCLEALLKLAEGVK